jgi:hypothetical protein
MPKITQIKKEIQKIQDRLEEMNYQSDEEYHNDTNSISYYRGQLSILELK